MFAEYGGEIYNYAKAQDGYEIITRDPEKAKDGFIKDGNVFYKKVDYEDLLFIFDITFSVEYDAGLPDTPRRWILTPADKNDDGTQVRLIFAEGLLPGWTVVDKNVCEKYVSVDDIRNPKIITSYSRWFGIDYTERKIFERESSVFEMISSMDSFRTV